MFDFCFKRLFSFCRELCGSGKGQRWARRGGGGRRVQGSRGLRPSWGMPRVALGAASGWGQVEGAGNTPFFPAAWATCPETPQTTRWTGSRGLSDCVPACGWGGSCRAASSCPIGLRISICASALSWEECARPSDLGEGQSWPAEGPAWWPHSGKGGGGSQGAQWEPSVSWGGPFGKGVLRPPTPRRLSSLCP